MRKRRDTPEVNAGSMADIAFQLLIFFLIATTMDTDKGLLRKLPPMADEKMQQTKEDVKERNVFLVLVNRNNQLLVENQLANINELRAKAKEFIENPYNTEDLPEKVKTEVPYFGEVMVTKYHVISLQNDRGTSYGAYMAVQNELTAAYNELRNQLAMSKFNMKYDDFKNEDDPRRKAIEEIYPLRISEAEPRNVGGIK
jgi:biopolymer transport protein ExbD